MKTAQPLCPGLVLTMLCLAQFMLVLDISVINGALASIRSDVGFAVGDLQWIVTACVLVFDGLLIFFGRAGDLWGRRRLFLVGTALVPVDLAVALAALRVVPRSRLPSRGALEMLGALTVSGGLLALIYGLTRVGPEGRTASALVAFVAALLLLGAFVLAERRALEPIVDASLLRLRGVASANAFSVLSTAVVVGQSFFLSLYLREVLAQHLATDRRSTRTRRASDPRRIPDPRPHQARRATPRRLERRLLRSLHPVPSSSGCSRQPPRWQRPVGSCRHPTFLSKVPSRRPPPARSSPRLPTPSAIGAPHDAHPGDSRLDPTRPLRR